MIKFKVTSGKVCISDPCYNKSFNETIAKFNVVAKNGTWLAKNTQKGRFMVAAHEDFDELLNDERSINHYLFDAAVDSGQVGVFDAALYPNGDVGEAHSTKTFYGKCCAIDDYIGVVDGAGVNSRTQFGDGSYPVYVHNHKDEVVAVLIDFDPYQSDEDDWEDFEFEEEYRADFLDDDEQ